MRINGRHSRIRAVASQLSLIPGYVELDISDAKIHTVKPMVFLASLNEARCYPTYWGLSLERYSHGSALTPVRHEVVSWLMKKYNA
ncbi:MAG: hypothetical protein QXM43_03530 [Desulfurococcaceae archaeon]